MLRLKQINNGFIHIYWTGLSWTGAHPGENTNCSNTRLTETKRRDEAQCNVSSKCLTFSMKQPFTVRRLWEKSWTSGKGALPGLFFRLCLMSGTLLSLGYFGTLFIIMCALYPSATTMETASPVSRVTPDAETQQPQKVISKHGLYNTIVKCYFKRTSRGVKTSGCPYTYST